MKRYKNAYKNYDEYLADLAEAQKKYNFPTEEEVLKIYDTIINEYKGKEVKNPEDFETNIIFKTALGIDPTTDSGKERINSIKHLKEIITLDEFKLAVIPVCAILWSNDIRDNNGNPVYCSVAKYFAAWFLVTYVKYINNEPTDQYEEYGFGNTVTERDFDLYFKNSGPIWWWDYRDYLMSICSRKMNNGVDMAYKLKYLDKEVKK